MTQASTAPSISLYESILGQVVQGPMEDEALGRTLRINPCVPTARADVHPSQAVIVTQAARHLIELSKAGDRLKAVLVAGSIDPMTHPDFREISENLRELMRKWFPKAELVLYTPGSNLDDPELRHMLGVYDRPTVTLDAGTQKTYAKLTGAQPGKFKETIDNLAKLETERWVLHTNFMSGAVDNSTDSEVRFWTTNLSRMKPRKVQLSTLKKPDSERKLKPISKQRLTEIAERTAEKTGLTVEIIDATQSAS